MALTSCHVPHPPESACGSAECLLKRVAQGDAEALGAIYDAFSRRAYATALRLLRNPWDAEEIVQETFVYVWGHAAVFDPSRGRVASWICMIARSRALDRRRRRVFAIVPLWAADAVSSPALGEAGYDAILVQQGLVHLTSPERAAIELYYVDGLTHLEIAHKLKVPLGTIKSRLRAGVRRMREALRRGPDQPEAQRATRGGIRKSLPPRKDDIGASPRR